jgi:tetratricopeptide (TPR) repeat protein
MTASPVRWTRLLCLALWACSPTIDETTAAGIGALVPVGRLPADPVAPVADEQAAPVANGPSDREDPAEALAAQASESTRRGEFVEAVDLWNQVRDLRAAELGAEHELTGRAWNNLSFALAGAGELEPALDAATRSVEIAVAGGAPSPHSGMARTQLADVAERLGRLDLAWQSAEAACLDFEASYGKTPMTGEAHERAGHLARRMGDLDGAETHFHWALAIAEGTFGLADPVRVSRPMVSLATVVASGGRVDAALQLLEHAGLVLEQGGKAGGPQWSASVSTRITLLESLGELDLAADLLESLVAQADPQLAGDRRTRLEQALHFAALGAPERARVTLPTPAIAPGVEAVESAVILAARAEVELRQGRLVTAQQTVEEALALPGVQDDLAATPLHLANGRVLRALGDERAVDVLADLFGRLRRVFGEDHPLQVEPLLALAAAEHDAHGVTVELLDALAMAEVALSGLLPERTAALLRRGLAGDLAALHLAVAAARPERAAASFASLDRLREASLLETSAWWIARGAAANSSSLFALLEARGEDGAMRIALDERPGLRARTSAAVDRLRETGSPWVELLAPRGATLEDARGLLAADDERLLLYSWSGDVLWAQVVGQHAAHDRLVELGPTAPLALLLARAQAGLRDAESPCDLGPLSAALLEPLWSELAGCTRVLIVADGPLAFLPFEALPVPGSATAGAPGRFWVETCRLGYGTSVRRLLERADAANEVRAGGVHVQQGAVFRDRPVPDLLSRLRGRFLVTPTFGVSTGDAAVLPDDELSLWRADALESGLRTRGAAGGLGGRRFVQFAVPGYVDASVPSATALLLGPEPDDDRGAWEREDGLLLPHELAALPLDVDVALLPVVAVGPDPSALDLRPAGLHALVASLWEAGAGQVLLSGWSRLGPPRPDFDRMLVQRLREGDPTTALWETQRAWLAFARERGDEALRHPGLWARLRAFGP